MLGHGKVTFETPNVIDLGDMPPSRPSRLQQQQQQQQQQQENVEQAALMPRHSGGHRPNYTDQEDHRMKFKPALSRTIKLNYSLAQDDEPEEPAQIDDIFIDDSDGDDSSHSAPFVTVTDPKFGVSQQLQSPSSSSRKNHQGSPSMENARLFAATMLAETERRQSQRNLMGTSNVGARGPHSPTGSHAMRWPRRGRRDTFKGLQHSLEQQFEEIELDLHDRDGLVKGSTNRRNKRLRLYALILAIGLSATFIFLAMRGRSNNHSNSINDDEVLHHSTRWSATMDFLIDNSISDQDQLMEQSSPQYQAANWIATQDGEFVEIPLDTLQDSSTHFIQRYTLATLYFALGGQRWRSSFEFLSATHECSWFEAVPDQAGEMYAVGATCNTNLQVQSLFIPFNDLEGSLPSELQHLTMLNFMSLKNNNITGTIPPQLDQLTHLEYLDLKWNLLTGTIPGGLGDLTSLQVLGLSKNSLSGTLPSTLGALPLKTLAIDNNALTGDLSVLNTVTSLEYLYAENNAFRSKLDNGLLENLMELRELDLSGNFMEALSLPQHLFNHVNLRVLDLHNNALSGRIPNTIGHNTVLQYLSLRQNHLSSEIPYSIGELAALTHLDLESNSLTGTLPATALAQLSTLTYLFLGDNAITTGVIPDEFQSLRSLRELSLNALQLTGPIPVWIENLSELRLLDLRENALLGKVSVDFANLPELRFLMLNSNTLTGPVPEGLTSLPYLQVLSMHHNAFIGQVEDLCNADMDLQLMTTDCGDISCTCCQECCDRSDCYTNVIWDALENSEGDWECNFSRSSYSFNPNLLYNDEK